MNSVQVAWHRFLRILFAGLFVAFTALVILSPHPVISQAASPVTGWLWSDTIGWISLNCSDVGTCGTVNYSVSQDASGNLSGYGWSDSVGWVSFNLSQLFGCPQTQTGNTSCQPQIVSGKLTGWIRVCAGMDDQSLNQTSPNNTCANTGGTRTDGWDGWISLYGTSPIAYGPTVGSGGAVTGFGWGSDVVGWTSFQATVQPLACQVPPDTTRCGIAASGEDPNSIYDSTNNIMCSTCTSPQICSNGACVAPNCTISASPQQVFAGYTSTITWSSAIVTSCSITGNGNTWSGTSSPQGGQSSGPINGGTTFTMQCTGASSASCTASVTVKSVTPPNFQER